MQIVTREQLESWMKSGGKMAVIEVLEPKYFRKFHLPGAMNVPLGDNFAEDIQNAVPDKTDTVVVYCANESCDASPKAARRMEELGYQKVYDYEAGKEDWNNAGLPVEKAA